MDEPTPIMGLSSSAVSDPTSTLAMRMAGHGAGHDAEEAGPVYPDNDLPWALWMEGVEAKVLRANEQANAYTMLAKFAPGIELPRHRHMGPVHAYTLQGQWRYLEYDWVAGPGSYVFEESLGTHTFKVPDDTEGDTICLFVIQGGLVLLSDDGAPWWYEDAGTVVDLYRAGLANAGHEFPEGRILT